jgi:hypothetical protein
MMSHQSSHMSGMDSWQADPRPMQKQAQQQVLELRLAATT